MQKVLKPSRDVVDDLIVSDNICDVCKGDKTPFVIYRDRNAKRCADHLLKLVLDPMADRAKRYETRVSVPA